MTAKKLLRHPWMLSVRKNLEGNGPVNAVPARAASPTKTTSRQGTVRAAPPAKAAIAPRSGSKSGMDIVPEKKALTVYDEAVQRVQEWNEALNGGSQRFLSSTIELITSQLLPKTSAPCVVYHPPVTLYETRPPHRTLGVRTPVSRLPDHSPRRHSPPALPRTRSTFKRLRRRPHRLPTRRPVG